MDFLVYACTCSSDLNYAGKPLDDISDSPTVCSGDLVQVELDVEIFRMMQEGHGGWSDGMAKVRAVQVHVVYLLKKYNCVVIDKRPG